LTAEEKQRSHDAVYANGNLKPFERCRVVDRIWAGRNPLTALDVEELASDGITHILDLREPQEWTPPKYGAEALIAAGECGIVRKSVPIRDTSAPTPENFDDVHAFLTAVLADQKAQVYIHCRAGIERTGAILIAYLARSRDIAFEDAYRLAREGRPAINLLSNQTAATQRWLNAQS
jgi:predicted protein tyrosine phosphatase